MRQYPKVTSSKTSSSKISIDKMPRYPAQDAQIQVLTTQITPTHVHPTQFLSTQAPPTQVPPTQFLSTQAPPTQITPNQVLPTQVHQNQVPPNKFLSYKYQQTQFSHYHYPQVQFSPYQYPQVQFPPFQNYQNFNFPVPSLTNQNKIQPLSFQPDDIQLPYSFGYMPQLQFNGITEPLKCLQPINNNHSNTSVSDNASSSTILKINFLLV